jgi:hypothetical protein
VNIHAIKTVNPYFNLASQDLKPFEVRKNDRHYKVGDWIILREYSPELDQYSNKFLTGRIVYILDKFNAIQEGYCILSIQYPKTTFDIPREVQEQIERLGYEL